MASSPENEENNGHETPLASSHHRHDEDLVEEARIHRAGGFGFRLPAYHQAMIYVTLVAILLCVLVVAYVWST